MAELRPRRVDVGFQGGQVLALRMVPSEHQGLLKALSGNSGGWHELKTQDSSVSIDLTQVVYVRVDTEEHKVGF